MRDHRNLKIFQLADNLVMRIYERTRDFPKEEVYGLTSQLRRGAVSVASNIVEGAGRSTENDFLRFLTIAHGSAKELAYQLTIAERLGYLEDDKLSSGAEESARVIAAFIKSFSKEERPS